MIIRIEDNGKEIMAIHAVSGNGCQYEVSEVFNAMRKPAAVRRCGVIAHDPADGIEVLALKTLQKITGK